MEIRRLTLDDLDACVASRLRALEQAPSAFLTTLQEQIARGPGRYRQLLSETADDSVIFGAVADAQVVGTVGIRRDDRPKLDHKAGIWGMFVDVGQRKRGIGSELLDLALDHARALPGLELVYLSIESTNDPARQLYQSRGFVVWGTEPKAMRCDGEYFDEAHLILDLHSPLRTRNS